MTVWALSAGTVLPNLTQTVPDPESDPQTQTQQQPAATKPAATLAPKYPGWEAFRQVRADLDPHAAFANMYLDRVLGRQEGDGGAGRAARGFGHK